jgi:LCP family protein required for cell wall assembly
VVDTPQRENGGASAPVGPRHASQPRRAGSLLGVLGLTALSTVLPGSGFLALQRTRLGAVVLGTFVLLLGLAAYAALDRRQELIRMAVQSDWLGRAVVLFAVVVAVWAVVVVATDVLSRPKTLSRVGHVVATAFTVLMCALLAVPFVVGMSYASAQREFLGEVFTSGEVSKSATRPEVTDEADPWRGQDRVNVLLIGSDAGPNRVGIRTDSIIVASIDVQSGDTVLFSLPRNLQQVPFAEGSKLDELYPQGFDGPGDPLQWMLNGVYSQVPELHPGVLGESDNEGADALKLAVSGALGIPVDYYALVSIPGFVQFIDAMGGVTVNIDQPIPIGGVEGRREPTGYLDPGPDQQLDGFEAMWFARGRYGLDDYDRMRRQRCLMDAVIERADPTTLLTRYRSILDAGKDLLLTDIPAERLPDFVDLAFMVKEGKLRSVVFARSKNFAPESPDYSAVHDVVEKATDGSRGRGGGGGGGGNGGGGGLSSLIDDESSCDFDPVG